MSACGDLAWFIEEVGGAWGPLSSEGVERCRAAMARVIESAIGDAALAASIETAGEREIHRHPSHGFLLLSHVESEGQYRVPHDHGSGWVIYGVVRGEMEMATYHRAITQRGEVRLVRRESYRMKPGECRVFLPGDIHDTRCVSPSVLMLRLTSCDLKTEDREGRQIKYRE